MFYLIEVKRVGIEELKKPVRNDEDIIGRLKELFPVAFKDGKLVPEILNEEVSALQDDKIESDEYFNFSWAGKREARKLAFQPHEGSLTLASGEGIAESETNNILIEGDNLEVLRILQKSYSRKIKLIYIDPPYNTGKDFVYKDDFKDPVEKYLHKTGQADEEGLLTSNPKASGRYHANWLNMMYPRLKLARNLLKDDGVIFVSIDDNEHSNLKLMMDEIFGEENFVTNIVWQKKYSPQNDATYFSDMHDFILVYAKKKKQSKSDEYGWNRNLIPRTSEQNKLYKNPDNDPRGPWKSGDLLVKTYSEQYNYPITTPSGRIVTPPAGRCWRTSRENLLKMIEDNRIWFGKDGDNVPSIKRFLSEVQNGTVPVTWWKREDCGDNQEANQELRKLFPEVGIPFDTPKPVRLIKKILQLATSSGSNDIVLDFFAGSGTTAQAVLEMNKEDGGNRNFIVVQIPEKVQSQHFSTIADVTKERIRRSLTELVENNMNSKTDLGFKVFKMKSSNLKKWNYSKDDKIEDLNSRITLFTSTPFITDYKEEDIIFELLLLEGFPLNSNIKTLKVGKRNKLWIVEHSDVPIILNVCLDTTIDEDLITILLNKKNFTSTFVCIDDALTNQQKVMLSETMNVKTI